MSSVTLRMLPPAGLLKRLRRASGDVGSLRLIERHARAYRHMNQTYIEPEVSYNFESGWYVDCDPSITFDWTADAANGWTIPMGADIGKALTIGSHSLSLQGGAYDLLKRPDGAPQWIMRVSVTFLFPTGIK